MAAGKKCQMSSPVVYSLSQASVIQKEDESFPLHIVLSPSQQCLAYITTTDQWCCGCLMSLWKQNKEDGVPQMDFHARQHYSSQNRSRTVYRCQCFCIQIAILGLLVQLLLPLQIAYLLESCHCKSETAQQMPACWRSTACTSDDVNHDWTLKSPGEFKKQQHPDAWAMLQSNWFRISEGRTLCLRSISIT